MEQVMEGMRCVWWRRRKKCSLIASVVMLAVSIILAGQALAGETGSGSSLSALEGIKIKSLAYLDYSNGKSPLSGDRDTSYNSFAITRGYFTLEKTMNPWMAMRLTMDVHQDETGDYKVREKYFYAALMPKDLGPFTEIKSEIGLGHIPWLDFEEHINPYRCQGTMAIERAGVFNSADLGISLQGNFGKPLEGAKEKTGNSHYTGRYGSWHVGVYNGGGYHAAEVNENKVPQWRFTLRPMPDVLPGLQLSYFGVFGKGNTIADPDYSVYLGMISFEHPTVTLTAQYFQTEGNAKGAWVTGSGRELKTAGFSAFGNFRMPVADKRLSVFGRYDYFDSDKDNLVAEETAYNMVIGGFSYDMYKGNLLLVSLETTSYDRNAGAKGKTPTVNNNLGDDWKLQAVYQINF